MVLMLRAPMLWFWEWLNQSSADSRKLCDNVIYLSFLSFFTPSPVPLSPPSLCPFSPSFAHPLFCVSYPHLCLSARFFSGNKNTRENEVKEMWEDYCEQRESLKLPWKITDSFLNITNLTHLKCFLYRGS